MIILCPVNLFGDSHCQIDDTPPMIPCVGRFFVDSRCNYLDKGFEEVFKILDEDIISQGNGRLRGERFRQSLILYGKGGYLSRLRILGVEQLKNADNVIFMISHGDHEH